MALALQSFAQFHKLSDDIVAMTGPGGVMAQIENYFDTAAQLIVSRQIHVAVTSRMRPMIRAILHDAWTRSGLEAESESGQGKLYDAATNSALIDASPKGITIQMSKSWDKSVFARAGAFLYGAVYGPREIHDVRNPITGALNVSKSQIKTSVLGEAAKRSIKKAFLKGQALSKRASTSLARGVHTRNLDRRAVSLGEVHVRKPRSFWDFTSGEIKSMQEAYIRFVIDESAKVLKRHRALRGAA